MASDITRSALHRHKCFPELTRLYPGRVINKVQG
jgi:hypothetical protein